MFAKPRNGMHRLGMLVIIAGLGLTSGIAFDTASAAAQRIDINSHADSYTKANEPSRNFGTVKFVRSMRWVDSAGFAKFNLNSVPAGATVDSAKLRLNIHRVKDAGKVSVHRVLSNWDEYKLTHQNKPALGPAIATFQVAPADAGTTMTVDVTALAKTLLSNPATNYGIALVTSDTNIAIRSREFGPAPQLQILTAAGGGSTNDAPVISGSPPASVAANSSYGFTPTSSDPDGDSLTHTIRNKPSWATFNSGTGRIAGVPTDSDVGVHGNISITASDGTASATLGPFEIEVTEDGGGRATLSWTSPTQNTDGTQLQDLAGFRINWTRTNNGTKGSVNINNPSVSSYTLENLAAGNYEFYVVAVNSKGVTSAPSNKATDSIS